MGGEVVLLDEQHLRAANRRVPSDGAAVDAAADDEEVVVHRAGLTSFQRRLESIPSSCHHHRMDPSLRRGDVRRMGDRLLVIDEGTTSTRAMLFARDGTCLAVEQRPLTQHYPRPGWVEHDAEEIWRETLACARAVAGDA